MRLLPPRPAAVFLATAVIWTSSVDAQITFQVNRITDINVDTDGVQVIAAGNFRNNARQDIVAVDNFGSRFFIYLNDGSGNFPTAPTEFGTGDGPVAITVGDFNLDGNLDVATANEDADSVTAYLGDGTGNFDTPHDYDIPDGAPQALVAVDIDSDRDADLAVVTDETVYLLRSNGDGTFTPFNPASLRTRGSGGIAIVAGLLNNDQNQDLAIALADSNQVSVFYGAGDGTFNTPQLQNVGATPNGIVAASLKTAGTFDLAVVDLDQDPDQNVSLLLNNGSGGFAPELRTTAEVSSIAIAAGDFDGLGAIDLAVTNVFGGQSVAFLQNNPDAPMSENGFLLLSQGVGIGDGASAIQTANLNGDGLPDLIVLASVDGENTVIGALINTSGQTPAPTNTSATTPGTPTPTPPATASFTPTGPSVTPTATDTPLPTSTPTAIPTVPYTLCNTNQPNQPAIGGKPVAVATGRLDNETPFIAVADNTGNKLAILAANITSSRASACALLGLRRLADVTGVVAPRAVISQTVDLNGNRLPLDLDRDGKTDLAVVGTGGLSIFFGNGAGAYEPSPANPLPAGTGPLSIGSTDYNRDGLPDIIVANSSSNDVSIFLGTGGRSLATACPVSVGRRTNLVLGQDLNRDGRPDFVAGSDQTNDISVFLQAVPTGTPSTTGTPAPTGTPTPIGSCTQITNAFRGLTPLDLAAQPSALVVDIFDFTDSVPDLAVALSPPSDGSIQIYLGRSMGSNLVYQLNRSVIVPRPTPSPAATVGPSRPSALGSGDVNNDGREDLIVTDHTNGTLVIFLADSTGQFGASLVPLPVEPMFGSSAPMPAGLAVADQPDIDGDGKPDIVVANEGDGSISIFVSAVQPSTPTPVPTGTPTETGSPTITPTETAVLTASPTASATGTITATATPTNTRSPSPRPSSTPKPGTFNLSSGCAIDPTGAGSSPGVGLLAPVAWLIRRYAIRRRRPVSTQR